MITILYSDYISEDLQTALFVPRILDIEVPGTFGNPFIFYHLNRLAFSDRVIISIPFDSNWTCSYLPENWKIVPRPTEKLNGTHILDCLSDYPEDQELNVRITDASAYLLSSPIPAVNFGIYGKCIHRRSNNLYNGLEVTFRLDQEERNQLRTAEFDSLGELFIDLERRKGAMENDWYIDISTLIGYLKYTCEEFPRPTGTDAVNALQLYRSLPESISSSFFSFKNLKFTHNAATIDIDIPYGKVLLSAISSMNHRTNSYSDQDFHSYNRLLEDLAASINEVRIHTVSECSSILGDIQNGYLSQIENLITQNISKQSLSALIDTVWNKHLSRARGYRSIVPAIPLNYIYKNVESNTFKFLLPNGNPSDIRTMWIPWLMAYSGIISNKLVSYYEILDGWNEGCAYLRSRQYIPDSVTSEQILTLAGISIILHCNSTSDPIKAFNLGYKILRHLGE